MGSLQNTHETLSVSPFGLPAFNSGMIAPGNHNFEKFAALCNTLSGAPRALRAKMLPLNEALSILPWFGVQCRYRAG